MSDGLVQVPPDSTGKKVDTSELVVNSNTVERQRIVLADPTVAAALLSILNTNPAGSEYGIVTRPIPSGTQTVSGSVTGNAPTSSTASTPAQTAVGTSSSTILALNANRKQALVQNTGTTTIYLVLGTGTPTTTVYHIALTACGAANDGSGGSFVTDTWTGAVKAIGSAGGGTVVVTELT